MYFLICNLKRIIKFAIIFVLLSCLFWSFLPEADAGLLLSL